MAIVELGLKPEDVPMILLPYQQKWVADNSGVKIYSKSRRIGISWAEAGDRALAASSVRGENTYYIGYEKSMAQGFISDCADWAKAYNLVASEMEMDEEVFRDGNEEKSILIFRIYFNSGYRIEALSSKPRNLRSRQGCIVIDEAAFHDDLPGLLKAAKALRIWGSRIHVITTYNGIENDYYEMERDVITGKLPYSRHYTSFRDAIAQGLYQRICLMQGISWTPEAEKAWVEEVYNEFGEDAEEELDCVPKNSGGAFFSRTLVEGCMSRDIPVIKLAFNDEFALKSEDERRSLTDEWLRENIDFLLKSADFNLRSFYGIDFARSKDLSVLMAGQEQSDLTRRVLFSLEMRNVPFRQQEQILFFIGDRLPRFVGAAHDARGNGQYLAEVAAQRWGQNRVAQVMTSQEWYREWFAKYKAAFEDKKILLPASADIIADHRQVVVVRGVPTLPEKKNRGTDGKNRHGDSAIAGVMMWRASELGGEVLAPDFGTEEDYLWVEDEENSSSFVL